MKCCWCANAGDHTEYKNSVALREHRVVVHASYRLPMFRKLRSEVTDTDILEQIRKGESIRSAGSVLGCSAQVIAYRLARIYVREIQKGRSDD